MKAFLSALLLLVFLGSDSNVYAYYAYRITFSDKNNSAYSFSNPQDFLSQRAISRRIKYNIAIDSADLPVNSNYIQQVLSQSGATLHTTSRWNNSCVIFLEDTSTLQSITQLSWVLSVQKVSTNISTPLPKPSGNNDDQIMNDFDSTFYGAAWNQIHLCNGEFLHEQSLMGEGVLVAVIDVGFSGVDGMAAFDSMFDNNRMLDAYNFLDNSDNIYYNSSNHGTKVLSIMAGYQPGTFVGTAPKAFYALYVTDDAYTEQSFEQDNWIAAVERADSLGADLITTSLGYNTFDDAQNSYTYNDLNGHATLLAVAANTATSKGMLVLASAGNEGANSWQHILTPGDADSVLTVGAVNVLNVSSNTSGKGPNASGIVKPDVVALGVGVANVDGNENISNGNGTSYATPIIAGLAACLLQTIPTYHPYQMRHLIRAVSDHFINPDNIVGYGLPNFKIALQTVNINTVSDDESSVLVFPNPVRNTVNIQYFAKDFQLIKLSVNNILGKVVLQNEFEVNAGKNIAQLDFSSYPAGVYFCILQSENKQYAFRFIKN